MEDKDEKTCCCHHSKSETGRKKKSKRQAQVSIYDAIRVPKIKDDGAKTNPEFHLEQARLFDARNCLSQAFESYIYYFEALEDPSGAPPQIQTRFTQVMVKLSGMFETANNDEEAIKCYLKVINLFPKNAIVLNLFGVYMFQRGEYNIAKIYLDQGSKLGFLPADRNLLHVLWHQIPRWHFRMLNDRERNRKYASAIDQAISDGARQVFDLGAGCGLLSLISLQSHEQVQVCAFEQSQALSQMLAKIVAKKSLTERIKIYCKYSTDFEESPSPCDLIVTEVFDVCLFGERALETLNHAINTFIREGRNCKVIPSRAKIYVTGIESTSLNRKYRFNGSCCNLLNLEDDFCLTSSSEEPYEAEILTESNSRNLTKTVQFLEVDFYNRNQLQNLINENPMDDLELDVIDDGCIDFLAVWFDLYLDSETILSTDPKSPIACWEQGIFHLDHSIKIHKGQKLVVKPLILDNQLNFQVKNHRKDCQKCWRVSKELVTFLNDEKLVQVMMKLAQSFDSCHVTLLDLSNFPLFGLLLAKNGAQVHHVHKEDSSDLDFLKYLLEINNLDASNFRLVPQQGCQSLLKELKSLDYVFNDLVGSDGSWCKTSLSYDEVIRLGPKLIPEKVLLRVQLIKSDYLDFSNKVDDENSLNLGIGNFMNEFTGSEHPGLENFAFSALSTLSTVDISNLETSEFQTQVLGLSDGSSNGILYWFEFSYFNDISFSTFDSWYYLKSCALFGREPKFVRTGDVLEIRAQRFENYMKITCIS